MSLVKFRMQPFALRGPLGLIALAGTLLTGCAVGQVYVPPGTTPPASWQASLPHGGQLDQINDWWGQFDDATVATLVAMSESGSPSLTIAWANIEKARATLASVRSGRLPSVNASASASRERSLGVVQTARSAGFDSSWELDLFGKLRRNEEAATARVEARTRDWHDTRVSLAAEVADVYVQWQACGLLADAYDRALASNQQTETVTTALVRAGLDAVADGALAQASVASAADTLLAQQAQCDLLVKAMVYLSGAEEGALRALLEQAPRRLAEPRGFVVTAVPAQVLRQRPDLGALEREVAATHAEIGAAQAALYPSLSLSGSIGLSATTGTPSSAWSFGPSISLPIFDGGSRQAAIANAQAAYRSAYASYQQGVRQVVKDVEQSLVRLNSATSRAQYALIAETRYRDYFLATDSNWRAGKVSLLTLEEARRSALSAEVQRISLQRDRVQYWIALYKAVGGGWTQQLAQAPAAGSPTASGPTVGAIASDEFKLQHQALP